MQSATPPGAAPPVLLVMGVSGSGKTTVGSLLAGRLGWIYAEADAFHPSANLAKMAAGRPLDDADRAPWLDAIGAWIDRTTAEGHPAVVTCSALKRGYRDRLCERREHLRLVFLDAPFATISARLSAREGHFFPAELLATQFRDLQPPEPDEEIVRLAADEAPYRIVDRLIELGVAT